MERYRRTPTHWLQIQGETGVPLERAPWLGSVPAGAAIPLAGARFIAPVAPSKILCVGKNYRAHAQEMGGEVPREPLLFMKPASSLLDPGGTVRLPRESERVEHEAELALVIGRKGRRISTERALDHVFGYIVACDVTARDLQKKDGQWTRAKGFDTFCPVSAEIVCGVDPSALAIHLRVGEEVRQDGSTGDMVFDVATLVAYASNVMTLLPGDLILTGTPEGVGPLLAGDHVRIEIAEVGALEFDVAGE